ncbi:MAG TPA: hypothetical protein VHM70_05390 [Polyangiaceae bacterium]|nr:hypothetical protein [Polyangiaceae bacterium]
MTTERDHTLDDPVWCLVGNIGGVRGAAGEAEQPTGTRHFSFGTKVFCLPPQWGDGYEKVLVIGRHRGSRRLIMIVMPSRRITNWRVQVVYKPDVLGMLERGGGRWQKEQAEGMARSLRDGNSHID